MFPSIAASLYVWTWTDSQPQWSGLLVDLHIRHHSSFFSHLLPRDLTSLEASAGPPPEVLVAEELPQPILHRCSHRPSRTETFNKKKREEERRETRDTLEEEEKRD